jgi:hypothetical protein
MNLTKDSILLLHAIHSLFYWQILQKTIFFSGFKTRQKNPPNKKTVEPIHEQHFEEQENVGRKPDRNSSLKGIKFLPRSLD